MFAALFYPDEAASTTYPLSVHCNRSGHYQAFYFELENDTCIISCFFIVEVEEVRREILKVEFSVYRKFPTIYLHLHE